MAYKKCGDCGRYGVRPQGDCIYVPWHWKGQSTPRVQSGNTRATHGDTKRCPQCREAQNGRGCFISACKCDCHRVQARLDAGLSIQPSVGPALLRKTFAQSRANVRFADQ